METKRIIMLTSIIVLVALRMLAVPAHPQPAKVVQPDGSVITILLHGDEYMSYETTLDGYTVLPDAQGYYVYAALDGPQLRPTGQRAHDADSRSLQEEAFLRQIPTFIHAPLSAEAAAERQAELQRRAQARQRASGSQRFDYSRFRGLIILVEYEDCSFSRSDYVEVVSQMINQRHYAGYMTNAMISEEVVCTGSVRDYFYDNSLGLFDPVFDIVGPVTIPYSQYDAQKSSGAQLLVSAAVQAADSLVNFSDFDTDGNGTVDMVYFIFAGAGANFSGNDQRLLWPHASQFLYTRLDGVNLGRYACSTELYGHPSRHLLDGIGTICHEFGHVLGQVDEYDTDYEGSGGQSVHPGKWSVMASGSYLNESRTPAGYSMLQRMIVGWGVPQTVTETGAYSLSDIGRTGEALRINSSINDEFFLLENRQQHKWDAYLPGHGLLVWRVDSTNPAAWANNQVNTNPSHNYYELVRAALKKGSNGLATDYDGDPFPGSRGITILNNNTEPSLRSWTGINTEFTLADITEVDSVITFGVIHEDVPTAFEDFETMASTTADTTGVVGRFCSWTFIDAVVQVPADSLYDGHQAVGFLRKGECISSRLSDNVQSVSFSLYNPTSSNVVFRLYYSTDDGATWVSAKNTDGSVNVTAGAGTTSRHMFQVNNEQPVSLRFQSYTGSRTERCYLDDIDIVFNGTLTPVGIAAVASESDVLSCVHYYDMKGVLVATTPPNAQPSLPANGIYLRRQGDNVRKIYWHKNYK